jgi:signal transduction histidine kinase
MLIRRMETPSDELKRYVRFSAADSARLVAAKSRVEPQFERIAAELYERVREHEGAHSVFSGEAQIQRLQRSLVEWLERLFGGTYDEAYFDKTVEIGRVHVKIGLPQRYVLAAMALVRSALLALLRDPTDEEAGTRDAIGRLIDIELAIMLDAYQDDLLARVAQATRRSESVQPLRATTFEERAVTAMEVAPMLVIAFDASRSIVLFNRAAESITGYAQDEVLGRDFVSNVFRFGVPDPWDPTFAADEGVEAPLTTRSGKTRLIRWRVVRPSGGRLAFAFGIDVTDDASARDRDQRQRRLAALGTLTTGLAHEIRNPLNGARLHTAYLERALADSAPETVDAVRVVKSEIQRLARLVDDFLEFAQPRALVLAPVEARALVHRIVSETKVAQEDLPLNDIVFFGDVERLREVLRSLVTNAVEAGAEDVVVRVRREPHFVRFEVDDNGSGLEPGEPVFDPFYTTKADGTGLGLAIAHRIVTDHGGTIEVDSRPGNTRFRLRLPCTVEGRAE